MVSELHRMGYQRLRIMPFIYPLAYRVAIAPAEDFSRRNGAYIVGEYPAETAYTSASENRYFGWTDMGSASARELAERFVTAFPEQVARGRGRDWAYAGWLAELVGFLEQGEWLPFVMEEYYPTPPEELREIPIWNRGGGDVPGFPLPPDWSAER